MCNSLMFLSEAFMSCGCLHFLDFYLDPGAVQGHEVDPHMTGETPTQPCFVRYSNRYV